MSKDPKDLYLCDPSKNFLCRKTECFKNGGRCAHTSNIHFADVDKEAAAHKGPLYKFLTGDKK